MVFNKKIMKSFLYFLTRDVAERCKEVTETSVQASSLDMFLLSWIQQQPNASVRRYKLHNSHAKTGISKDRWEPENQKRRLILETGQADKHKHKLRLSKVKQVADWDLPNYEDPIGLL